MGWAFRCPKTGLCEFVESGGEQPCPFCKERHEAYEVGAPPAEPGMGNVRPPFKRGYSMIHGRDLRSWSDFRKANRELGLIETGIRPEGKDLRGDRIQVSMRQKS